MTFHSHSACAFIFIAACGLPVQAQEQPVPAAEDPQPAANSAGEAATVDAQAISNFAAALTGAAGVDDPDNSKIAPLNPNESPEVALDPNDPAASPAARLAPEPAEDMMDMAAVIALVRQQQAQLAQQQQMLADQSRQLKNLRGELDSLRQPGLAAREVQIGGNLDHDSRPIEMVDQAVPAETDDGDATPADHAQGQQVALAPGEEKTRQELKDETSDMVAKAQADDPTAQILTKFPGAWRLPGTRAALAVGGYVKSTLVYNQDPLEITDRFIVGSIPVDSSSVDNIEAESSITASQSRLNFDLREPTEVGILRAFIEGDFASDNDTFRLRHAFGQWNRVLAGKTWSAFVDTKATPEEVDFEGLNGRVNVRQSQMRFSPQIGEKFEFQFSLEDPNPKIQNGNGVTRTPDFVVSGRFQPNERLHTKVAILGRQIRAQQTIDGLGLSGVEKQYGWGLTVSGRYTTPRIDERDSLLFQLNAGKGIGRYVNDLASVGNYDGIFNPNTGDLELFDVVSGYLSLQHWWGVTSRSNFTLGYVELENPGFVEGDAYKRTIRGSANLFWTPTPRIDIGVEFLFGRRENQDGEQGDASQLQMAARYRFR